MIKLPVLISFFIWIAAVSSSFAARIEAESVTKIGGAADYSNGDASGGMGVKLGQQGDAISFSFSEDFITLKVNFMAVENGQLTVQAGDEPPRKLYFPKRYGDHVVLDFLLGDPVESGTPITISFEDGDFFGASIDYFETFNDYPYLIERTSDINTMQWPNTLPDDSPFPQSPAYTGIELTGRTACYTDADTFYPIWGPDGIMYASFTDGPVGGFATGTPSPGQVSIEGDDPLKLNVKVLGLHPSTGGDYQHGRYPSAHLLHNGIWYYGTYLLTWEDSFLETPIKDWQVMEPFAGFRTSSDGGRTWIDNTDPNEGLFEPVHHTYEGGREILIGGPRVVDFGQDNQYAPVDPVTGRKYTYMVAHGANADFSHSGGHQYNSWVRGNNIYILRILLPEGTDEAANNAYINDASNWQYYDKSNEWSPWNINDLEHVHGTIKPLIEWQDHLGHASMTYNAALEKYMLFVTRSVSVQNMTTLMMVSDNITGPFEMIHYLEAFGPRIYFTNVPSKFISEDGKTMWLWYSSNYVFEPYVPRSEPSFPGSLYSMCMAEINLKLAPSSE